MENKLNKDNKGLVNYVIEQTNKLNMYIESYITDTEDISINTKLHVSLANQIRYLFLNDTWMSLLENKVICLVRRQLTVAIPNFTILHLLDSNACDWNTRHNVYLISFLCISQIMLWNKVHSSDIKHIFYQNITTGLNSFLRKHRIFKLKANKFITL